MRPISLYPSILNPSQSRLNLPKFDSRISRTGMKQIIAGIPKIPDTRPDPPFSITHRNFSSREGKDGNTGSGRLEILLTGGVFQNANFTPPPPQYLDLPCTGEGTRSGARRDDVIDLDQERSGRNLKNRPHSSEGQHPRKPNNFHHELTGI